MNSTRQLCLDAVASLAANRESSARHGGESQREKADFESTLGDMADRNDFARFDRLPASSPSAAIENLVRKNFHPYTPNPAARGYAANRTSDDQLAVEADTVAAAGKSAAVSAPNTATDDTSANAGAGAVASFLFAYGGSAAQSGERQSARVKSGSSIGAIAGREGRARMDLSPGSPRVPVVESPVRWNMHTRAEIAGSQRVANDPSRGDDSAATAAMFAVPRSTNPTSMSATVPDFVANGTDATRFGQIARTKVEDYSRPTYESEEMPSISLPSTRQFAQELLRTEMTGFSHVLVPQRRATSDFQIFDVEVETHLAGPVPIQSGGTRDSPPGVDALGNLDPRQFVGMAAGAIAPGLLGALTTLPATVSPGAELGKSLASELAGPDWHQGTTLRNLAVHTLKIELNPPDLGHVIVRMRLVEDALSINVRARSGATLRALETDRASLNDILTGAGYRVESLSMEGTFDGSPAEQSATRGGAAGFGSRDPDGAREGTGGRNENPSPRSQFDRLENGNGTPAQDMLARDPRHVYL